MDKAFILGGEVTGNIGSCNVLETTAYIDFWHRLVMFTNSCTGEIVREATYFDWGVVVTSILLAALVCILVWVMTNHQVDDMSIAEDMTTGVCCEMCGEYLECEECDSTQEGYIKSGHRCVHGFCGRKCSYCKDLKAKE